MPDPRFARLQTDPRFRRPKKLHSKVSVDDRFKAILPGHGKSKEAKKTATRVDKYGRRVSSTHDEDNLGRFYRLENTEKNQIPSTIDYARGELLLESSDEEGAVGSSEDEGIVTLGGDTPNISQHNPDGVDIDLNEDDFADLAEQAANYARDHPEQAQEQDTPRTHRLAAVNLDWDHVRASHLYKICSSLVSPAAVAPTGGLGALRDSKTSVVRGKVLSVRVYPSEFGKERMAREDKEGPPAEIFQTSREEQEINERNIYEVGQGENYDEEALRRYQLERLRYYYAIITCDTTETASHIYSELEGTELERSANLFDLSFVPDNMSFDEDFRDEWTVDVAIGYKNLDFTTDALRHSKVKLTWDEDEPERAKITRRALSRKEIEEADFKAYIASSSSESDAETSPETNPEVSGVRSTEKLRALLLGGTNAELPEGWGNTVEDDEKANLEITFTPGLTEARPEHEDETTLQKYQRKMKEKRKKQKERAAEREVIHAKSESKKAAAGDDFFDAGSGDEETTITAVGNLHQGSKDKKSRLGTLEQAPQQSLGSEELALLVASEDPATEPKHFNMKSVLKAEKKAKGKRKKRNKRDVQDDEQQEDFEIDVNDDRFKALHEDHTFAIDPSNPHFKKTKSMGALLEERTKRQNTGTRRDVANKTENRGGQNTAQSLYNLVESVKRKSVLIKQPGGKRQKV